MLEWKKLTWLELIKKYCGPKRTQFFYSYCLIYVLSFSPETKFIKPQFGKLIGSTNFIFILYWFAQETETAIFMAIKLTDYTQVVNILNFIYNA